MAFMRARQPEVVEAASLEPVENPPAPVSPERAALADAIAAHARSEATYAATVAAEQRANEAVWAAQTRVEDATTAVEDAKRAAVHHLVAIAAGTAGEPPATIRQARDALVDAEEGLQAARNARDMLQARSSELHKQRGYVQDAPLQRAALDVIRVEAAEAVAALAAEVDRLQRELMRHGGSLLWMASKGIGLTNPAVPDALMRLNILAKFGGKPWDDLRCPVPWEAAMATLMADAGAVLPGAAP